MNTTDDIYETDDQSGDNWRMLLGDACERLAELPDGAADLAIYSPPFSSLYVYSASVRDLGNSASREEFFQHYQFIIREMLRITKPGRMNCVHVMDVPTTKATHGVVGLTDFSGEVIRAYEAAGWIYVNRITIRKNPQALRHGQKVLTPAGWIPIEHLVVGDQVIGSDGTPTKVEGVWPQGVGQIYRVTFSDGATVDCDAAHLWTVRAAADLRQDRWRTLRTEELLTGARLPRGKMTSGVLSPAGDTRFEIPIVQPVQYDPTPDLLVHPYVLGALLGDGSMTGRRVQLHTQRAIVRKVAELLPPGHSVREMPNSAKGDDMATFGIQGSGHWITGGNAVTRALQELGIYGQRAWEKRVPERYLRGSVQDRRDLLTGLMDTDGSINLVGSAKFSTTSPGLAEDVVSLVRSLGGLAHLQLETTRPYKYKGELRNGRPLWGVSIELDGPPLVTLKHKVARWRTSRRRWSRRIVSIIPVGMDERTCITVAADDGLFVTEGFVVTHNSAATRTKSHGLAFATLRRDRSQTRPVYPDYLLLFRKPGQNAVPITSPLSASGDPRLDNDLWIRWAEAIWDDIRETNTLNVAVAREDADERHLCPLQLDLIERCVKLWSNVGEQVVTPFGGIGSEVVTAVKFGRRGLGVELKRSYYRTAVDNLRKLDAEMQQTTLWSALDVVQADL